MSRIQIKTSKRMQAMGLLQEECAEVIQAVSKIRRTGTKFKPFAGEKTNLQLLKEEVQDVLVLLELLGMDNLTEKHRANKLAKLERWSSILQ